MSVEIIIPYPRFCTECDRISVFADTLLQRELDGTFAVSCASLTTQDGPTSVHSVLSRFHKKERIESVSGTPPKTGCPLVWNADSPAVDQNKPPTA